MVFVAILAGGKGTRVGTKVPKQFLIIDEKPVIIHTIDKFVGCNLVDQIYVSVNEMWIQHTTGLINDYYSDEVKNRIHIVNGGEERMMTLKNVVDAIAEQFELSDNDVFLSHDAVRPFVTDEIIADCIAQTKTHKVAMASIQSADTTYRIDENGCLIDTYNRKTMYVGQTPQGCGMKLMYDIIHSFTHEELLSLTGTSQLFIKRGYPVKVSLGSVDNIKITTPMDIEICKIKMKEESNGED